MGWTKYAAVAFLFTAQGLLFLVIPSNLPQIYLSPDETAVAVTAREFGTDWSFRLPDNILKDGPWIRPRSFVTHDAALVPVGFLGMPLLAGMVWKFLGEFGLLLLTPCLVLACIYPLWRFMRGFGFAAQVAGVAAWLSFPMVILYANRGLFPNLAMVCLMLWAAFLVWKKLDTKALIIAGLLTGMAVAIRPTEIVWAGVWIAAAWVAGSGSKFSRHDWKNIATFLATSAVVPAITALLAWKTYGAPWMIGYWLRDSAEVTVQSAEATALLQNPGRIWPFGFHPRAVLNNAENYLVYILGPWAATALVATVLWIKRENSRIAIMAGAWTAAVLCLIYGNTVYQDHVGHNIVSVGNSYLRYLLPLAPFFALAVGAVSARLVEILPRNRAKLGVSVLAAVLVALGIWTAFSKDDEGLNSSVPELVRYETIRETAYKNYGRNAIVVSERSDKIFFPVMRAVTPVPDDERLKDLAAYYSDSVLLFDTTYGPEKIQDMAERGLYLNPVLATKNQTLYEVTLLPVTSEPDMDIEPQP